MVLLSLSFYLLLKDKLKLTPTASTPLPRRVVLSSPFALLRRVPLISSTKIVEGQFFSFYISFSSVVSCFRHVSHPCHRST